VLKTSIGRLRLVGYLEGISFLILLGIAMPLKYAAGMPEAVLIAGWIHGVLFVLFVAATLQVARQRCWSRNKVLAAAAASVLPFGPFVLDARLLRSEERAAQIERAVKTD
jgi:integral membrane protein